MTAENLPISGEDDEYRSGAVWAEQMNELHSMQQGEPERPRQTTLSESDEGYLRDLADRLLREGHPQDFLELYALIGHEPSARQILECARGFEKKQWRYAAVLSYWKAGSRDDMQRLLADFGREDSLPHITNLTELALHQLQ